jgi:hypothetical protein
MLFFEFFPAFMAIVALIAGLALFAADRDARRRDPTTGSGGRK